ncbi:MAG: hypothetical protein JHD16_09285 [Solirubrobacteraceae bacterium]|nr:hypothetical protein [Solirubrobacteraceae bacterium]
MTTPQTTTRSRGIRQPLPAARPRAAYDRRAHAKARRRRILLRFVPAVALAGLLLMGLSRLADGSGTTTPSEVAVDIQDQVKRDIISRTDDYSVSVGPLSCVELKPGKGNCLADVKLGAHRADNVMVAVTYTVEDGEYDLVIKLP